MPDLRALQASPSTFRQSIFIDCDGKRRVFGDVCEGWQERDFLSLDGSWLRLVHGLRSDAPCRAWLERCRGGSKTSDLAAMTCWCLWASKYTLRGVVGAADLDQARLLRDAISTIIRCNVWLGKYLTVQRDRIVNQHTDSELTILTSDGQTSYGLLPDFVLIDELTHHKTRDLWDSLFSAAAKRKHCLLCVITNAGHTDSWQWELREAVREDPAWYFSRQEKPAGWITNDRLAEQERLLPSIVYRRLWLNEWTSGRGDALSPEDISDACILEGPTRSVEDGYCYVAGLDIGLSRDASALVILGKHIGHYHETERPLRISDRQRMMCEAGVCEWPLPESDITNVPATHRIKLVGCWTWHPSDGRKIQLDDVENTILTLHRTFNFTLGFDPYQAIHLAQRLSQEGVRCEEVGFTGPNLCSMCSEVLSRFAEHTIELFPHDELLADLHNLQVAERSYGTRLESPRGPSGHGDSSTSLAIALHCSKETHEIRIANQGAPLLCYP